MPLLIPQHLIFVFSVTGHQFRDNFCISTVKNKLDHILACMALHLLARLIIPYSLRCPVALISIRTKILYPSYKMEGGGGK